MASLPTPHVVPVPSNSQRCQRDDPNPVRSACVSSVWSRAQHHSLTPAVTMPLPPVLLIPPPGDDILFQTPTAARAHSGTTVHAANIELRTIHNGPNQLKTWPESSRAVVCRRTGGISPASAGCQNESATRWPAGTDTAFVARTLPLPSLPRAGRPAQTLPSYRHYLRCQDTAFAESATRWPAGTDAAAAACFRCLRCQDTTFAACASTAFVPQR